MHEVEVGYDISNEFFRLWLDERMHYTCAVYDEQDTTLEQAQRNKSRILADFAEVKPESLVLDIGCGWGANLEYLVLERKVQRGARHHAVARAGSRRSPRASCPGVTVWCTDYKDFAPKEKYDALISIEMIDHLVSPAQQQKGLAVPIYREYFDKVAQWVKPGACFGFQAILRNRVPRTRKDLADLKFTADVIFPGGLNPRLEELVAAAASRWEIVELQHPPRGLRQDDRRVAAAASAEREEDHREKWGEKIYDADYDRYLSTCVRAFENHWSSDVQMKLRRIDV